MTDKEKIIIDGVDVSKCSSIDIDCGIVYCSEYGRNVYCESNNSCYYKQLARKTQECEELEEQDYKNLKIIHSNFNQIKSLRAENTRYRKALEEIEEELKEDIYCESQECGCDDSEECLRCTKDLILDIINKAKDGK